MPRNMEQHSRQVQLAHLVPGELPELLLVRVQVRVVPAVDVASEVTQPDIIAGISKEEAWDIYLEVMAVCGVMDICYRKP